MTTDPTSMKDSEADVVDVAAATQRRPDFVAEALSPSFRVGLLLLVVFTSALLCANVRRKALWETACSTSRARWLLGYRRRVTSPRSSS